MKQIMYVCLDTSFANKLYTHGAITQGLRPLPPDMEVHSCLFPDPTQPSAIIQRISQLFNVKLLLACPKKTDLTPPQPLGEAAVQSTPLPCCGPYPLTPLLLPSLPNLH